MKPVYFLSDAHLGSRAIKHGRTQERRLVRFLDSIKEKAGVYFKQDHTHASKLGAQMNAQSFAKGLKASGSGLAKYLK